MPKTITAIVFKAAQFPELALPWKVKPLWSDTANKICVKVSIELIKLALFSSVIALILSRVSEWGNMFCQVG